MLIRVRPHRRAPYPVVCSRWEEPAVGGAVPAPRPLNGRVFIALGTGEQKARTVAVGPDGKSSLVLTVGTYSVTGESPLYGGGHGRCSAPKAVTLTVDGAVADVICQEM